MAQSSGQANATGTSSRPRPASSTVASYSRLAPEGTVTEAYTWLSTGIAAGLAAGAAIAGALGERHGAGSAFVLAGSACAAAALAGALARRTLTA